MSIDKLEEIKNYSFFDDSKMIEIANSLSDEDKERYKKIGEEMYNTIDFDNINQQGNNMDHESVHLENLSQLKLMLSSGIHPSYLTNEEKDMLKNSYGDKWFKKKKSLEI